MTGLKAKASLLFLVSAVIFTGVVIFGNTIAAPKTRKIPEINPNFAKGERDALSKDVIGSEMPLEENHREEHPEPQNSQNGSANITKNLAALIGKNIVDKNPTGPDGENLSVPGADDIANIAASESLKNFNPSYFLPEIPEATLVIDPAANETTYQKAVDAIIAKTESLPPPSTGTIALKMQILAKRYTDEAESLRAIPVPPARVSDHARIVRIALGRGRVLEAVADYENDPIYAMLALKLWETIK